MASWNNSTNTTYLGSTATNRRQGRKTNSNGLETGGPGLILNNCNTLITEMYMGSSSYQMGIYSSSDTACSSPVSITGNYNFRTQTEDGTISVTGSQASSDVRVFALHNVSGSAYSSYKFGTNSTNSSYYGYYCCNAITGANSWHSYTSSTGRKYFSITVNQHISEGTYTTMSVTAGKQYTFNLHTVSLAPFDGIILSKGLLSLTGSAALYSYSDSNIITYCYGSGGTTQMTGKHTITYTPSSSGTVYIYYKTDEIGGYSSKYSGYDTGDVEVIEEDAPAQLTPAVYWSSNDTTTLVGGATKRQGYLTDGTIASKDTGGFSCLSSSVPTVLIEVYNSYSGGSASEINLVNTSSPAYTISSTVSNFTGLYDFYTQSPDGKVSVQSNPRRKVFAIHNYYNSTSNPTNVIGYRCTSYSGPTTAYYGYTTGSVDTWVSLDSGDGEHKYYAITVRSNYTCAKQSISVQSGKTYTFNFRTYSENGQDGILLSTTSNLTYTSAIMSTSASGYLKHCTGINSKVSYTYNCTSTGTIYLYFRTNNTTIVGPSAQSSAISSLGDVEVIESAGSTVTVTLNLNGGTSGTTSVTGTAGSIVAPPADPTRTNNGYEFVFMGWYSAASGGNIVYGKSYESSWILPQSNMTVYAHWQNYPYSEITGSYDNYAYCSTGTTEVFSTSSTVSKQISNSQPSCAVGTPTVSISSSYNLTYTKNSSGQFINIPSGTSQGRLTYTLTYTTTGGTLNGYSYEGGTYTLSSRYIQLFPTIIEYCDPINWNSVDYTQSNLLPASQLALTTSNLTNYYSFGIDSVSGTRAQQTVHWTNGQTTYVDIDYTLSFFSYNPSVTSITLPSLGTTETNSGWYDFSGGASYGFKAIYDDKDYETQVKFALYIYYDVSTSVTLSTTLSSIGMGSYKVDLASDLDDIFYPSTSTSSSTANAWTTVGDVVNYYKQNAGSSYINGGSGGYHSGGEYSVIYGGNREANTYTAGAVTISYDDYDSGSTTTHTFSGYGSAQGGGGGGYHNYSLSSHISVSQTRTWTSGSVETLSTSSFKRKYTVQTPHTGYSLSTSNNDTTSATSVINVNPNLSFNTNNGFVVQVQAAPSGSSSYTSLNITFNQQAGTFTYSSLTVGSYTYADFPATGSSDVVPTVALSLSGAWYGDADYYESQTYTYNSSTSLPSGITLTFTCSSGTLSGFSTGTNFSTTGKVTWANMGFVLGTRDAKNKLSVVAKYNNTLTSGSTTCTSCKQGPNTATPDIGVVISGPESILMSESGGSCTLDPMDAVSGYINVSQTVTYTSGVTGTYSPWDDPSKFPMTYTVTTAKTGYSLTTNAATSTKTATGTVTVTNNTSTSARNGFVVTISTVSGYNSATGSKTITFNQAAGSKVYATPTITQFTYDNFPANGLSNVYPTLKYSQTWTWNGVSADSGTDSYTYDSSHTSPGGSRAFTTTGTLPSGFSTGTSYSTSGRVTWANRTDVAGDARDAKSNLKVTVTVNSISSSAYTCTSCLQVANQVISGEENMYKDTNGTSGYNITSYGTPSVTFMSFPGLTAGGGGDLVNVLASNDISYYYKYTSGSYTSLQTGTMGVPVYWKISSQTFTPTGGGSATSISRFTPSGTGTTITGVSGTVYPTGSFTHSTMGTNGGTDTINVIAYNSTDVSKTATASESVTNTEGTQKYKDPNCLQTGESITYATPEITINPRTGGTRLYAGQGYGIVTCTVTNYAEWYYQYTSGSSKYYGEPRTGTAKWKISSQSYTPEGGSATTCTRFSEEGTSSTISVGGSNVTVYNSGDDLNHSSMYGDTGTDSVTVIAYNVDSTSISATSTYTVTNSITWETPSISFIGGTYSMNKAGGTYNLDPLNYADGRFSVGQSVTYTSGYSNSITPGSYPECWGVTDPPTSPLPFGITTPNSITYTVQTAKSGYTLTQTTVQYGQVYSNVTIDVGQVTVTNNTTTSARNGFVVRVTVNGQGNKSNYLDITFNQPAGEKVYGIPYVSAYTYDISISPAGVTDLAPAVLTCKCAYTWNGVAGSGNTDTITSGITYQFTNSGTLTHVTNGTDFATTGKINVASRGTTIGNNRNIYSPLSVRVKWSGDSNFPEDQENNPKTAARGRQLGNYLVDIDGGILDFSYSNISAGATSATPTLNNTFTFEYSSGSTSTSTPPSSKGTLTYESTYSLTSVQNGFTAVDSSTGVLTATNRGTTTGVARTSGSVTCALTVTFTHLDDYAADPSIVTASATSTTTCTQASNNLESIALTVASNPIAYNATTSYSVEASYTSGSKLDVTTSASMSANPSNIVSFS